MFNNGNMLLGTGGGDKDEFFGKVPTQWDSFRLTTNTSSSAAVAFSGGIIVVENNGNTWLHNNSSLNGGINLGSPISNMNATNYSILNVKDSVYIVPGINSTNSYYYMFNGSSFTRYTYSTGPGSWFYRVRFSINSKDGYTYFVGMDYRNDQTIRLYKTDDFLDFTAKTPTNVVPNSFNTICELDNYIHCLSNAMVVSFNKDHLSPEESLVSLSSVRGLTSLDDSLFLTVTERRRYIAKNLNGGSPSSLTLSSNYSTATSRIFSKYVNGVLYSQVMSVSTGRTYIQIDPINSPYSPIQIADSALTITDVIYWKGKILMTTTGGRIITGIYK